MLELAMKIIFCLLIAALLGGIIGFLLGRISRCEQDDEISKKPLYDYDEMKQHQSVPHQEVFASMPDATIKKRIEKGIKPITFSFPQNGESDDLKEISGIGIKIENSLYELGIFHFFQIAEWTPDNVVWIDDYFNNHGRVEREEWIDQAKKLILKPEHPHH